MTRIIDHRDYGGHDDVAKMAAAQADIRALLLWRTVAKVSDDTLLLDDGTHLTLRGNDGCGGCDMGNYDLAELNGCPNAVTAVEFEDVDYETYRIFVLAENQRVKLAEFTGQDNGYYGTGYWIEVIE